MGIKVTVLQDSYLRELATGPKTTRDLAMSLCVTTSSAGRIIDKLRNKGLIKSRRLPRVLGNIHEHKLTAPYSDLGIYVVTTGSRSPKYAVSDEEIRNVARLRNKGLLGRRLIDEHKSMYPFRSDTTILKTLVPRAKSRGLCR